jgi:hypothetical protein
MNEADPKFTCEFLAVYVTRRFQRWFLGVETQTVTKFRLFLDCSALRCFAGRYTPTMVLYSTFEGAHADARRPGKRRQANTLTVLLTATAFGMAVVVGVVAIARGNLFGRGRNVALLSTKGYGKFHAASKPRLQKLMPLEVSRDIHDVYTANEGDTEERAEMKKKFGSMKMSASDKKAQERLHKIMDEEYQAGTVPPLGSAGGVTAARNMGPAGSEDVAWYGNWWVSMRPDEVLSGLERMTGLRNIRDGRNRLVDAGINVDGWEPGRNASEVVADENDGENIPAGFWTAEGKKAHEPDVEIHHPCGSALRKRPCAEDQEFKDPVDLSKPPLDRRQVSEAWSPITGVKEPLWVDPVP